MKITKILQLVPFLQVAEVIYVKSIISPRSP